jgi:ABC-type Na+ efflux pump permease subunit
MAWWEFIQKVKTKAFILSMILSPVIMGVFSILPVLLTTVSVEEPKKILILDKQQEIGELVKPSIDSITYGGGEKKFIVTVQKIQPHAKVDIKSFQQSLLNEEYVGMFVIPSDIYTSKTMEYHGQHVSNARELEEITDIFEAVVQDSLLQFYGIQKSEFKAIRERHRS